MGHVDDGPSTETTDNSHLAQTYQDGDIQVEYHPNSGRATDFFKIDEYRKSAPNTGVMSEPEPWAPFRTREDFEFAEIALGTGMTRAQTDAMIKLFHRCIKEGEGSFTLLNHKDMADTFRVASNRLAKVCYGISMLATPLIETILSLKRKLLPQNTRVKNVNLRSGCDQSQSGLRRCYRMRISFTTLFGMLSMFQGLIVAQGHGSRFLMSHGLQDAFGRYR